MSTVKVTGWTRIQFTETNHHGMAGERQPPAPPAEMDLEPGRSDPRSCLLSGVICNLLHHQALSNVCAHLTPVRRSITKKTEGKCWRGCADTGTLVHCWRECELVQPPGQHCGGDPAILLPCVCVHVRVPVCPPGCARLGVRVCVLCPGRLQSGRDTCTPCPPRPYSQ